MRDLILTKFPEVQYRDGGQTRTLFCPYKPSKCHQNCAAFRLECDGQHPRGKVSCLICRDPEQQKMGALVIGRVVADG